MPDMYSMKKNMKTSMNFHISMPDFREVYSQCSRLNLVHTNSIDFYKVNLQSITEALAMMRHVNLRFTLHYIMMRAMR